VLSGPATNDLQVILYQVHLKALEGFLQALEVSADWALLSSFCDDSNLRISVFK